MVVAVAAAVDDAAESADFVAAESAAAGFADEDLNVEVGFAVAADGAAAATDAAAVEAVVVEEDVVVVVVAAVASVVVVVGVVVGVAAAAVVASADDVAAASSPMTAVGGHRLGSAWLKILLMAVR